MIAVMAVAGGGAGEGWGGGEGLILPRSENADGTWVVVGMDDDDPIKAD